MSIAAVVVVMTAIEVLGEMGFGGRWLRMVVMAMLRSHYTRRTTSP